MPDTDRKRHLLNTIALIMALALVLIAHETWAAAIPEYPRGISPVPASHLSDMPGFSALSPNLRTDLAAAELAAFGDAQQVAGYIGAITPEQVLWYYEARARQAGAEIETSVIDNRLVAKADRGDSLRDCAGLIRIRKGSAETVVIFFRPEGSSLTALRILHLD